MLFKITSIDGHATNNNGLENFGKTTLQRCANQCFAPTKYHNYNRFSKISLKSSQWCLVTETQRFRASLELVVLGSGGKIKGLNIRRKFGGGAKTVWRSRKKTHTYKVGVIGVGWEPGLWLENKEQSSMFFMNSYLYRDSVDGWVPESQFGKRLKVESQKDTSPSCRKYSV